MHDELSPDFCQLQGTNLLLSMGDMQIVETRSEASWNERWISDAYVVVFGSDNKYKFGERVDVSTNLTDNGELQPTITTGLSIETGDIVVVLCNTGCTFTSIPLDIGTSTLNDINTAFPSTTWVFDWTHAEIFGTRKIPMCGVMTFGTDTECQMIRAYAKVDLTLAPQTGVDKMRGAYASTMTDAGTTWRNYNVVLKKVATLYNPTANCAACENNTISRN